MLKAPVVLWRPPFLPVSLVFRSAALVVLLLFFVGFCHTETVLREQVVLWRPQIAAVGEADEPGGEGSKTGVITGYTEARDGARAGKNRCRDGTEAEEGTADEGGRGGEVACRKGAEGEEHFRAADAQRGGRVEEVLGGPTVPKMYSSGSNRYDD